jgi:hypothetical protein
MARLTIAIDFWPGHQEILRLVVPFGHNNRHVLFVMGLTTFAQKFAADFSRLDADQLPPVA